MSACVQLDLFNKVMPISNFDWHDKQNLQIFDYTDDIEFNDPILVGNYIINVPMYKIEDLAGLIDYDREKGNRDAYWKLVSNKKFNHCTVRITDKDDYTCGKHWFILANAKTKKFVKQQSLFALLKGAIKKKPRLYTKVVQVSDISYRNDLRRDFVQVYTLSKWHSEHVLSKV